MSNVKLVRSDEPKVNQFQIKLKVQMSNKFLRSGVTGGVYMLVTIRVRRIEP